MHFITIYSKWFSHVSFHSRQHESPFFRARHSGAAFSRRKRNAAAAAAPRAGAEWNASSIGGRKKKTVKSVILSHKMHGKRVRFRR